MIELTEAEKDRFWSKVKKTDSCWNWTGYILRGYGFWRVKGKGNFRVHHISYQLAYGEIPEKKRINHRCNNHICVNPSHLSVETPSLYGLTNVDIIRFWSKVQKTDSCWYWRGTTQSGYGVFRIPIKNISAHRLSYQLAHGEIPAGKIICHRCNNPLCVNPAHLYAGTPQDNVNDAITAGHQIKGTRHHQHKLTDEQVREIRQTHIHPGQSLKATAALYGVHPSTIWLIVSRKIWRHL